MASRIATTRSQDLQPLAAAGQTGIEAWRALHTLLLRELSPAHAALLAEPVASPARGEVDWYAEGDGAAIRLQDMAEPARTAAQARLDGLVGDIEALAARLSASRTDGDRFLSEMLGLALRLPGPRPVDLLLSSTGSGRRTRQLPVLRRDAAGGYGSIMAYRTTAGPVRLAAVLEGGRLPADREALAAAAPGRVVTLSASTGRGVARLFATVTLRAPSRPLDPDVRFDAVLHAPPGLVADGPLARFRRPAYAAARAARS